MSRNINVYHHSSDCRCRRCNPPPTNGEIVGSLVVIGLLALLAHKVGKD